MINLNIQTKLGIAPSLQCQCQKFTTIKRGASAEFTINFADYPYVNLEVKEEAGELNYYCNIEQFIYLFKMPDGSILEYPLFRVDSDPSTLDTQHFYVDFENNCLSFVLGSTETLNWPVAYIDDPVTVEAVFKMDTDKLIAQKSDSVIIEAQPPVVVVDSLYRESKLDK